MMIVWGVTLLLGGSAFALLQPWPLKLVVDTVLGSHEVPVAMADLMMWVSQFVPPVLADEKTLLLLILCTGILLIQLFMGGLTVLSTYILVAIGLRMVFRLRCRLFHHLQRLSLAFHDTTTVGDSLYRVTWDTYCVQALFNSGLIPALIASFTLLGIAGIMLFVDWVLTLVALAIGIPLLLLIRKLDRPMRDRSLRAAERDSDISTRVQETLSSIRAVQAFGREAEESQRFGRHADASLHATLRLTVLQSGSQAIVGVLLAAGTAAVVGIGAWRVLQGVLTVGDIVLLVSYLAMLYKPLETLAYTAATIQNAAASAGRVLSILDRTPEVRDNANAVPLASKTSGPIIFDHVSFAYDKEKHVLKDVCLEIPAGQTVALVGHSGAGKTTLVNLVMRFYDPTDGHLRLNNNRLQSLTLESLRKNMALVLQEPVLFCSSIRENIAYGRPEATNDEIEEAARAAGAHDFIQSLASGYDTQIGERGVALSGGQRQRLSIARAFLKDAPILILDEPTSALDSTTERQVLDALRRLMNNRTTLIIAHRLSTVRDADQIVVLDNGRIVEQGTHQDLVKLEGQYARLYCTQVGDQPSSLREVRT
ncbi:MAG: protein-tyrosine-phosphatase [Nitrospirales bacterium]|nr:MAG: protein-tyrosine-phosphatase [Nitrospirales bacterium]